MGASVSLTITFLRDILEMIPDSPFIFLFGLAFVLTIIRNIFVWVK